MYIKEWVILLFIIIVSNIFFMASPFLTALNIDYIANDKSNLEKGIFLFALTLSVGLLKRIIDGQTNYMFRNFGTRMCNLLRMTIYHKSLRYSPLSDKKFSEAEIINYSQTDAGRLGALGYFASLFFFAPLKLIVGLGLMYAILGLTFLSSIGILGVILLISYFLTKTMKKLNEKMLKAKDKRLKVTEEMLDIIRFIKISAIEKFFYQKVNDKRERELKISKKKFVVVLGIICLYWTTCPLLLSSAFLLFTLLGNQITSGIAFTTMSAVNILEGPMFGLPNAVN